MMNERIENIVTAIKKDPIEFYRFTKDVQQVNPLLRIKSIQGILEEIDLPKNSTILDIGTGYGYGAILLNALGYNVIGLEVNKAKLEEGIKYWQKKGIPIETEKNFSLSTKTSGKLYFIERDARNLKDIPTESIDMMTSFYISGYMVGKKGPFQEAERILKRDGRVTITTEGPQTLPETWRKAAVHLSSKLFSIKGLELASIKTINKENIYDKHVLTYKKLVL